MTQTQGVRLAIFFGAIVVIGIVFNAMDDPITTPVKTPEPVALPPHIVDSNTALPNGRRIQINVNDASITKADCRNLILAYKKQAAPDGQVSVRKPNPKDNGMYPWCIENFGGSGIKFQDYFFE
jgi:hypothetical protein